MTAILTRTLPASDDTTWQDRAACARDDPERWFPVSYGHNHPDHIPVSVDWRGCKVCDPVRICRSCPVVDACLNWWMRTEDRAPSARRGIFGGTTPSERARIYRRNPGAWL